MFRPARCVYIERVPRAAPGHSIRRAITGEAGAKAVWSQAVGGLGVAIGSMGANLGVSVN